MKKTCISGLLALSIATGANAEELDRIGISVSSLGNPFFIALAQGAEFEATQINPNVKITTLGFEYDLETQVAQIEAFVDAGVDLLLLTPADPVAINPAIQAARDAGVTVIAVDNAADAADATITTNNVQAGEIACQHIVDRLNGRGNVIIQNGPQNSAVIDRVNGCRDVLNAAPAIAILSEDLDGRGSQAGGEEMARRHFSEFSNVDALFAINDPQAIGINNIARQLGRSGMVITAVDGAPAIEEALVDPNSSMIEASASQNPFAMAKVAVQTGYGILNGDQPDQKVVLLNSELVTRDNVADYAGWETER